MTSLNNKMRWPPEYVQEQIVGRNSTVYLTSVLLQKMKRLSSQ